MTEPTPLGDIEADAIRYRIMQRDQAELHLREGADRILRQMGMPEGSQIQVLPAGALVAIAPAPAPEPAE